MEDLSCTVSNVLDSIGYSQEIINIKRNFWQAMCDDINLVQSFTSIIAGSKAEGITAAYESDIDRMCLPRDVICTDNPLCVPPAKHITVLQAATKDAPPGYTRLKLLGPCVSSPILQNCFFETDTHEIYLSSSLFAADNIRHLRGPIHLPIVNLSGPAVSAVVNEISTDTVVAFPCYHSLLLNKWKRRRRPYNWPPADVIKKAASALAQLVPVGCKRSLDQWREWRFCFIESELQLIYSLNETQIQLYILLKMVSKNILRNANDAISSYIMKNIVFWFSELLPDNVFRKKKLLQLLLLALQFLYASIKHWNYLPYYMIPERNLLAERLTADSRRELSGLIEELLAEGPRLLLRCTKLQTAMTVCLVSPYALAEYREKRNVIETLHYVIASLAKSKPNSWELLKAVLNRYTIVLPEFETLLFNDVPVKIIVSECETRIRSILS